MTPERRLERPTWMVARDIPGLAEIESLSFRRPWSRSDIARILGDRVPDGVGTIAMGIRAGGRVVGYVAYQLMPRSICMHRLAVHPDWRKRGIGEQLLAGLATKLRDERPEIELFIRETNLSGQHYMHSQGYRASEVMRGWFSDTGEDAYRMCVEMDSAYIPRRTFAAVMPKSAV